MPENFPRQFKSTEEEIAFLKEQIAEKERELLSRAPEADRAELEVVGKQEIREYSNFTPELVLSKERRMDTDAMATSVGSVEIATDKVNEVLRIADEKGIHNALTVLEKMNDPYLTDEVHRALVEELRSGKVVHDLKEGVPPWHILHMTLFEVALPEEIEKGRKKVFRP